MNILIVEDDVYFAQYLTELIEGWGHITEKATSGKEALERFAKNMSDMVLLDIFLPDIEGYELIPHLKRLCPQIGIVTMTGYNSRDLEMRVREQGILYYMIKPFETEHLQSLLHHISQKHSQTSQPLTERRG